MRPHSGLHYSKIYLKGQLIANDFATKTTLLSDPNQILANSNLNPRHITRRLPPPITLASTSQPSP